MSERDKVGRWLYMDIMPKWHNCSILMSSKKIETTSCVILILETGDENKGP